MTARRFIPALALLLVTAPLCLGQDEEETPIVPLERIAENPVAFQNLKVSFVVQYHRPGKIDSPFRTQFERDWYMNFSAWPDGAPVWEKGAYKKTFDYLFIPRRNTASRALLLAPKFSRWLITGRIASSYQDKPWVDISDVRRLDTELNTHSHKQLVRGFTFEKQGRFNEAALAFRMADQETLPKDIRTLAMRSEANALNRNGDTAGAFKRLEEALQVFPEDRATQIAMQRMKAIPATPTLPPAQRWTEQTQVAGTKPTPAPRPVTVRPEPKPRPVTTPRAPQTRPVEVVEVKPAPKVVKRDDGFRPPVVDNTPPSTETVEQGSLIPPLKKITLELKPKPVTVPGGGN